MESPQKAPTNPINEGGSNIKGWKRRARISSAGSSPADGVDFSKKRLGTRQAGGFKKRAGMDEDYLMDTNEKSVETVEQLR